METKLVLPEQPEIVREWFRRSRQGENRATEMLLRPAPGTNPFDVIGRADEVLAVLTSAFAIPAEVAEAYESWRGEYNAVVAKINQRRQARINAREISAVRSAACPRCFSTHAGEC